MATSETTGIYYPTTGGQFKKHLKRGISSVSFTTGVTLSSDVFETFGFCQARVTCTFTDLDTNSTYTLKCLTGPTTAAVSQALATSTGGTAVTINTTGTVRHVYAGLDKYTKVTLLEVGGSTLSTGVDVDVEFV